MRLLVTGGTGFVGRHVMQRLVASGYSILALRRRDSIVNVPCEGRIVWWNIEEQGLERLFEQYRGRIDAVVHIATDYGKGSADGLRVFDSNVAFPMSLLRLAVLNGVQRFINTDSFFNTPGVQYEHLSTYTLSKRHFMEWGKQAAALGAIRFLNMRLFHVYGQGDSENKFVPSLARACLAGGNIPMTDGTQRRDFVHVEDVAEAYLKVLQVESEAENFGFCSLDIGTGNAISIREFSVMLNEICGNRSKLLFGVLPQRVGEMVECRADIRGISATGWQPHRSLEQGLREVCDYVRQKMGEK